MVLLADNSKFLFSIYFLFSFWIWLCLKQPHTIWMLQAIKREKTISSDFKKLMFELLPLWYLKCSFNWWRCKTQRLLADYIRFIFFFILLLFFFFDVGKFFQLNRSCFIHHSDEIHLYICINEYHLQYIV